MSGRQLESADYEGARLAEMREWIEGGAGAEALFAKAEAWRGERDFLNGLAERVRERMKSAGAVIEGSAGEAMRGAVSPVVLWTEVTAANANAQSLRTTEQGEAFSKVHSSVPKSSEDAPVPEETTMGRAWAGLTGGKTDNAEALEKNEALRQEAVTAFNRYHNASQSSAGASAVFSPPPDGGVDTTVESRRPQPMEQRRSSFTRNSSDLPVTSHNPGDGSLSPGSPSPTADAGPRSPRGTSPSWSPSAGVPAPGGTTDIPARSPGGGESVVGGTPSMPPGAPGSVGARGGGSDGFRAGPGNDRGAGAGTGRGSGAGAGLSRGLASGGANDSGGGRFGPTGGTGSSAGGSATGGVRGAGNATGGAGRGDRTGEDADEEHYVPEFLKGDHGFFDEDLPKVAPPVFGDDSHGR